MPLNRAAAFAFACMALVTVLQLIFFARDLSAAVDGIIPSMRVVDSLIYLLAAIAITVFLYVFQRSR